MKCLDQEYMAKDVSKFMIGNYYWWEMNNYKDIKSQINSIRSWLKNLRWKNYFAY